ncbi:organic cation transporter protein [Megachile rotundata]|uniref:organic cation transporter protein n=1 Tax=Megachile rotundata TaxID=143995 RepID=UPI003FD16516
MDKLQQILIPSSELVPYEGHQLPYSRCWIYDLPVEAAKKANRSDTSWPMKKCSDWEYKLSANDVPYMSYASEQNWVCEQAYKVTFAQSIFFVGSIFGGLILGWLADKYGRVPVLVISNLIALIGSISTIFTKKFWQFCACRFIVGMAYDNIFVIAYILVLEYVGPKWRTFAANMSYGIFFTLGAISVPWIAYEIANWRLFAIVTAAPFAIVIIAPFTIPESIRWLISVGQIKKATKIIRRIEKVNKVKIPEDVYEEFIDDCTKTAEAASTEVHTLMDLFKTRRLRRFMILLLLSWGIVQMSYDGHIRSLTTLGVDVFTTFTIASATEFPAEILITYTLDILGRRWMLFGSVFLSGLFSLMAATVSIGPTFATLAICARFFINIAWNIELQYAAELLPTVVRGEGIAFIHVMGYVTSILGPVIAFSSRIMYNLPMIILGVSCIFAAALCLFLPETLMEQLPQTIMDGEFFGIDQSFWDTPFTKKKHLEPVGHHMHAKRPFFRPEPMRSSMVSGYLGNRKRLAAVKARASQIHLPSGQGKQNKNEGK